MSATGLCQDYKLKEGDTISVKLILGAEGVADFGPTQMNAEIPPGGMVSIPYVGNVRALGKSVAALQAEVTAGLRKRFPLGEAFVLLASIRPSYYSLIGEVRNGGQFGLTPGLTVREALARAEGTSRRPELLQAAIFRNGKLYKQFDLYEAAATENSIGAELVEPGDVISIQTKRQLRVWVAGLSKETGEVTFEEGNSLRQLTARIVAVPSAIQREQVFVHVMRKGSQVCRVSVFDLESGRASDVILNDGDFITISQPETTRIWVLGGVGRPGQYDLSTQTTMLQAIAAAAGARQDATLKSVTVMRGSAKIKLNLSAAGPDSDKTQAIQSGDIVMVGINNNRVAVLGQVNVPGVHIMNDDIECRLADAISLAGGLTRRGPANRIWILRADNDGKLEKIAVDFSKYLYKADAACNPVLIAGDVVMVGETNRMEVGEVIGAALGLFGIGSFFR